MNLNHIAKKPFFDLFYRTPCMHIILKAALHDAGTFETSSKTGYVYFIFLFQIYFNTSLWSLVGQEEV